MDTIINIVNNFADVNNKIINDYNNIIKRDKTIRNIHSFITNIQIAFSENTDSIKKITVIIRNQLNVINEQLQGYDYVDPSGSGFNSYQLNDTTRPLVKQQRELILKLEIYEIALNLLDTKLNNLLITIQSYTDPALYDKIMYLVDKKESIQPIDTEGRIPYRKYEVNQAMILLSDYLPSTRDLAVASKIGLPNSKAGFIKDTLDPHIADSLSVYEIEDGKVKQVQVPQNDNYFTAGIWALAPKKAIDFDLFNMKPCVQFNMGENRLKYVFMLFSKQVKSMVVLRDETLQFDKVEQFTQNQSHIRNAIDKIKKLFEQM
jgi:hypothetical protein